MNQPGAGRASRVPGCGVRPSPQLWAAQRGAQYSSGGTQVSANQD